MERDPVCGMDITEVEEAEKTEHNGKTYYFCSALCMVQFINDPEKFIGGNNKPDKKDELPEK